MTDTPGHSPTSHSPCVQEHRSSRPPGRTTPGNLHRPRPSPSAWFWGTSPHGTPGCRGQGPHHILPGLSMGEPKSMAWGSGELRSWQNGVNPHLARGEEGLCSGRTFLCPSCELCRGAKRGTGPRGPRHGHWSPGSSRSAVCESAGLSSA